MDFLQVRDEIRSLALTDWRKWNACWAVEGSQLIQPGMLQYGGGGGSANSYDFCYLSHILFQSLSNAKFFFCGAVRLIMLCLSSSIYTSSFSFISLYSLSFKNLNNHKYIIQRKLSIANSKWKIYQWWKSTKKWKNRTLCPNLDLEMKREMKSARFCRKYAYNRGILACMHIYTVSHINTLVSNYGII